MYKYLAFILILNLGCSVVKNKNEEVMNLEASKKINKKLNGEWIIHYSANLSNNLLYRSLEGPTNDVPPKKWTVNSLII